jgi:hypothetical protein
VMLWHVRLTCNAIASCCCAAACKLRSFAKSLLCDGCRRQWQALTGLEEHLRQAGRVHPQNDEACS